MDKLDYGYWNMDCMEGMKRFPDKYFEVAIVDPPYGINAPNMAMGTNKSRSKNGYPAESTASRIKRSKGAGQWDISWGRLFQRTVPGIEESNYMGRQLFPIATDKMFCCVGQGTAVGSVLTSGDGMDFL